MNCINQVKYGFIVCRLTLNFDRNYKFLVRAVNEDGDSPNLETEDFITAKNPFEVPSQPGKVKPADWGVDWAELQWKAPEDDGGNLSPGVLRTKHWAFRVEFPCSMFNRSFCHTALKLTNKSGLD